MKLTAGLILLLLSGQILAKNIFTISPYVVVEDKGSLSLNFQTAEATEFEVIIDGRFFFLPKKKYSALWSNDKLHKINLGKLKCGQSLRYKIKTAEETIDNAIHEIPCLETEPLYFGFMSDTQIKTKDGQERANKLSQSIAHLQENIPFSLIVNAGDIVQHGGYQSEWINFFRTTDVYLKNSILLAAIGNHEYFESPSMDKMPPEFSLYLRNGVGSDLGYAQLDLGKINILVINSNFESLTDARVKEQWEWLEGKLKTAEKRRRPTVVVMHHSPFSSNLEHVRDIPTRLRKELVPLLEKYKVKMMLSGHLHMYERSEKAGVTYLIAGPSGGINNVISYKNPYSVFIKQFTTTFSVLKVLDNRIDVLTYEGARGTVIDTFSVSLD